MKDKRFYAPDSGADMVSDAVNAAALTGANAVSGADGNPEYLLQVKNLKKYFPIGKSFLKKNRTFLKAVDGVSFNLSSGKTVGIVGESGCGKTTLLSVLLNLLPVDSGEILGFQKPSAVFQEDRLLPYLTAAKNISVAAGCTETAAEKALLQVGFDPEDLKKNAVQLSGGMAQRVTIALAACSRARLLIADEPTNGLDEAGRAQFFALLDSIFPDAAKLIITHDISVASRCDRVLVLCGGRMLETGASADDLSTPRHPYTKALLAAQVANGMQPSPVLREDVSGCPFYARCPEAEEACLNGAMSKHTDGKTEWWCCHA